MREIFNGIFYVMRAGCAWRLMPSDLRPWETTYRWFAAWLRQRRKKGGKFGNPLVLPQTLPHRPSTAHAACARRRKCARRKRDYTRAIYRAGRAPSVSRESGKRCCAHAAWRSGTMIESREHRREWLLLPLGQPASWQNEAKNVNVCKGQTFPVSFPADAAHLLRLLPVFFASQLGCSTGDRYFLSQAANACANARLPNLPFSKARMA